MLKKKNVNYKVSKKSVTKLCCLLICFCYCCVLETIDEERSLVIEAEQQEFRGECKKMFLVLMMMLDDNLI
jgi:hypothetical protein